MKSYPSDLSVEGIAVGTCATGFGTVDDDAAENDMGDAISADGGADGCVHSLFSFESSTHSSFCDTYRPKSNEIEHGRNDRFTSARRAACTLDTHAMAKKT